MPVVGVARLRLDFISRNISFDDADSTFITGSTHDIATSNGTN